MFLRSLGNSLAAVFGKPRQTSKQNPPRPGRSFTTCQLGMERLETREVFSALAGFEMGPHLPTEGSPVAEVAELRLADYVTGARPSSEASRGVKGTAAAVAPGTLSVENGILTIRGSDYDDQIYVKAVGSKFEVTTTWDEPANGGIGGGGGTVQWVPYAGIKQIVIVGEKGNDTIEVAENIRTATRIFGGSGDDVIWGGGGVDCIWGGMGNDQLYGRAGDDFIRGGGGSKDSVNGGSGKDDVTAASIPHTRTMSAIEQEILKLTNDERRKAGLKPLAADSKLAYAASLHANNMATRSSSIGNGNAHNHFLPGTTTPSVSSRIDYAGFEFRQYAENIAYGYRTAKEVVTGWMNSPPHRASILNASLTHLGVGVAANAKGTMFFAQNFGTPA